jgi:hypothetical protein
MTELERGADIRDIRDLLGHESVATTRPTRTSAPRGAGASCSWAGRSAFTAVAQLALAVSRADLYPQPSTLTASDQYGP